jgi:RecA/RadA recombinase
MPRQKKEKTNEASPLAQIEAYLNQNKNDHYNFETEHVYTVSSGSLLLDIEMNGGIRPGVVRATGVSEGGKTSCALAFARSFQKKDNHMAIYIKAEGRLSEDMILRAGIDTSKEKWFVYKSNVYESVIDFIRHMVQSNPEEYRYMFIIDSMDALIPRGDLEKSSDDAVKVAGGSLISSAFLKRMALGLATRGHICFMISQVRSKVSINQYVKEDPKLTNASGGNALLHYSDWILEFQERFQRDLIREGSAKDSKIIGHQCNIVFRKTPNEKTGVRVSYPIKYGAENGESVWVEMEIMEMMKMWDMVQQKGAWITVDDSIVEEVTKATGNEFKKQHQGEENFRKYLTENKDIKDFMFKKFKDAYKRA